MNATRFLCILLLVALAGCKLMLRDTPQQKLAELVQAHPELVAPETVRVEVPVEVPRVEVRTVYRSSPADSIRHALDLVRLDSLLRQAESSLDSVQRKAATGRIRQWIRAQPTPFDTLCFDTLGVRGRVWYGKGAWQLWLVRKELRATASATVVRQQLKPCPPAPVYAWYDPQGWPWWWVFVGGVLVGVALCYGICSLILHIISRR